MQSMSEPTLLQGAVGVDDRGEVGYINDFNFPGVKRFYTVRNHRQGFIRAWHGHRREAKYVTVVQGSALIGAIKIDNWDKPAKDLAVHRYVLSSKKPAALHIPSGYANGFMNLEKNTILIFFSTSTLEESLGDDVRYASRYWNPWDVVER
jgi:dTDP-4-dehydrorhamnose 3,5-epimerase